MRDSAEKERKDMTQWVEASGLEGKFLFRMGELSQWRERE